MTRIDLHRILQTVGAGYGDLVTRRTGQAVRDGIEPLLAGAEGDVALVDFSTVRLLDFSCADEVVGKLLLRHGHAHAFVLVGVLEHHLEAIEPVLERRRLAVVARDRAGRMRVVGPLPDPGPRVFGLLVETGGADPAAVALHLNLPPDIARAALEELCRRRLVLDEGGSYRPLHCA